LGIKQLACRSSWVSRRQSDDHHRTAMLSFAWIIAAGSAGSNATLNVTEY
jgi:hypothetical protein